MRFDKEGKPHTLEQDILAIWKEHGLEVIEETVTPGFEHDTPDKTMTMQIVTDDVIKWTIKAKRIKGYIPKIPS